MKDNNCYSLGIKLTALRGMWVESNIINGVPQKCVCIPMDENFLAEDSRGNIYLNALMLPAAWNKYKMTHRLFLNVPRDEYNRLHAEGVLEKDLIVGSSWHASFGSMWSPFKDKHSIDEILDRK